MARQPIDDLIDKPLNELTEEEARVVIKWQAKKEFEKMKHSAMQEALEEDMRQRAISYGREAEAAMQTLAELKERALAFYGDANEQTN